MSVLKNIAIRETYYGYRPHGIRRMSATLQVGADIRLPEKTTAKEEHHIADHLRRNIAAEVYGGLEEIIQRLLSIAKHNAGIGHARELQELEQKALAITRPCPTPKTTEPS